MDVELQILKHLAREARPTIGVIDQYCQEYQHIFTEVRSKVRANKWCEFKRVFSNETAETRYIREIIFGKRSSRTYWEMTTDTETMPKNSTSFVMTNLRGTRNQIKKTLGNLYGLRTWVEYGFRQCKQELGWTDYRFTQFSNIERWWEMIMSAYLMISLNTQTFFELQFSDEIKRETIKIGNQLSVHPQWNHKNGWKNVLNNLRLIAQPTLTLCLLSPWLDILSNSSLWSGLHKLIRAVSQFKLFYSSA